MRLGSRVVGGTALVLGACQALVGIDDKELDPRLGQTDGSTQDSLVEAGPSAAYLPTPPERPPGPTTPSGTGSTRWFAARTVFLGSVDPFTKQGDGTAWQKIGHDIDGECTTSDISTSDSSSICKRAPNAQDDALADGNDCRDNAAGRLFANGASFLSKDFEKGLHAKLNTGESATFLLRLDDLDEGPDDPYVRGSLYVSVPRDTTLTNPPTWDGSDQLTVDTRSLLADSDAGDPDAAAPATNIEAPRYVFDAGYLKGDVWVSGDFKEDPQPLPLFVFDDIRVVSSATATLVMELAPTHDRALGSMLSAVVGATALSAEFKPIADQITGCNPILSTLFMSQFLLPARDLGDSPSFATPGVACGALSLGFAFEWVAVQAPSLVSTPAAKPTCGDGDAGTDGGSDAG